MAKLVWDQNGERLYETGVKNVILYKWDSTKSAYGEGVAWNGVTAVTESPSGADATSYYADDQKYLELRGAEDFGFTIEAYMYPDEWMECDGSASPVDGLTIGQQTRVRFGLCYRTVIGNDTDGDNHGYKLHLIYNSTASPSEKAYQTINDSPEPNSMSWEASSTPVNVTGYKSTSVITIDSTKVNADKLAALEEILLGSESVAAKLPSPDEVIATLKGNG